VSTARRVPVNQAAEVDPRTEAASRIREDMAGSDWAQRLEDRHPRALDLGAELLEAAARPLRGVASLLCGTHGEARWRSMLRGVVTMPFYDVWRLFTEPTREAAEAADAMLAILAETRGYRLEPLDSAAVEAHEALAGVAAANGALVAELSRALANDGRLDAVEARDLEPELDALKGHVAKLEATVARAKARRLIRAVGQ
jgi:hypothetical protein